MPANDLCNRLISEYGDSIFRMCFLYLKDYHLAEDATQETFIKAVTAYSSFHGQSAEKTWITRIAINCCKNITRTKWFKTTRVNPQDYILEKEDTDLLEDLLLKDSISKAIMELKQEDREVIVMYYYQELSVKEIATVLKKSENTILQKLNRARKRLKEQLKEVSE